MYKKVFIAAGVLALTYAAVKYGSQLALLKSTCFNFNGYKLIAVSKDRLTIQINLRVRNKSDIPLLIRGYDFKIIMNQKHISTISSDQPQTLEPNQFSDFVLMVDINPSAILDANFLTGMLLHFNEAAIKIQGSLSIKAGKLGFGRVPLTIESKLKDMIPTGPVESQPCL